jgi:hypothetical protein
MFKALKLENEASRENALIDLRAKADDGGMEKENCER